jgi:aspartate/glutamate racemase
MISKELYEEKMRKAILFTGHNLKKEAVDVIYDEVKTNYTNRDFQSAIDDIMELEMYRLSGQALVKRLNYHRALRMEREAQDRKDKDDRQVKALWDTDKLDEICTHHKCFSCNRLHIRCDDIAKATIEGIKASFLGLISHADMMESLSKQFPGAGFEKTWQLGSNRPYVTMEELRTGKLVDLNRPKLTIVEKQKQEQIKLEAEYYGDDCFVQEVE